MYILHIFGTSYKTEFPYGDSCDYETLAVELARRQNNLVKPEVPHFVSMQSAPGFTCEFELFVQVKI